MRTPMHSHTWVGILIGHSERENTGVSITSAAWPLPGAASHLKSVPTRNPPEPPGTPAEPPRKLARNPRGTPAEPHGTPRGTPLLITEGNLAESAFGRQNSSASLKRLPWTIRAAEIGEEASPVGQLGHLVRREQFLGQNYFEGLAYLPVRQNKNVTFLFSAVLARRRCRWWHTHIWWLR